MAQKNKRVSGRNLVTLVLLRKATTFDTPQRPFPRIPQRGPSKRVHTERTCTSHITGTTSCQNCSEGTGLNPLNAELNPIRHLLALIGARHIVHVSRIRGKFNCTGRTLETRACSATNIRVPTERESVFQVLEQSQTVLVHQY